MEEKIKKILKDNSEGWELYDPGKAIDEIVQLFTAESKAYLMELIGEDEKEYKLVRVGIGGMGKKTLFVAINRNQLRRELREKISGTDEDTVEDGVEVDPE